MGVKHFYYWYSRNFKECVHKTLPFPVTILAIDMNGLFHGCAQKVYRYGEFADSVPLSAIKTTPSLIRPTMDIGAAGARKAQDGARLAGTPAQQEKYEKMMFEEICTKVEDLRKKIKPSTTLLLCVDGVAGLGKMNQQRQRRFRASQERQDNLETSTVPLAQQAGIPAFNSNGFTPGTPLMDRLTRYIDRYIRMKQSSCPEWHALRVIFSNEKAPGEGEHKIMHYVRQHGTPKDSVCIHGMDGDLVMLGLLLPTSSVVIAREQGYYDAEYISITEFRHKVLEEMNWTLPDHSYGAAASTATAPVPTAPLTGIFVKGDPCAFHASRAIQDFVVLCFTVGNDFLPTIPALSIMDGGLPLLFRTYRDHCRDHGHLTHFGKKGAVQFSMKSMGKFLESLARLEQDLIATKYSSNATFFRDPIFEQNLDRRNKTMRMDSLLQDYYAAKFPAGVSPQEIVHKYIEGMMWVINYYRAGIPDWIWSFPYLYSPFLCDLARYWKTYVPTPFTRHQPVDPFLQLIMVLPPADQAIMVPPALHPMHQPSFKDYFPDKILIDLGGKKKEWEGIVLIPLIPYHDFHAFYAAQKSSIPPPDARRNIRGKTFRYQCNACDATRGTTLTHPEPRAHPVTIDTMVLI